MLCPIRKKRSVVDLTVFQFAKKLAGSAQPLHIPLFLNWPNVKMVLL